ncbi:hypothetical protein MXD81_04290 [Microbacteriaceae bacterium K1510]|nr:hypothetical protein [Microbacteriaceae bacterium K1510]
MRVDIASDRRDDTLEQIEPAVDVADRVNPGTFGRNGLFSAVPCPPCRSRERVRRALAYVIRNCQFLSGQS